MLNFGPVHTAAFDLGSVSESLNADVGFVRVTGLVWDAGSHCWWRWTVRRKWIWLLGRHSWGTTKGTHSAFGVSAPIGPLWAGLLAPPGDSCRMALHDGAEAVNLIHTRICRARNGPIVGFTHRLLLWGSLFLSWHSGCTASLAPSACLGSMWWENSPKQGQGVHNRSDCIPIGGLFSADPDPLTSRQSQARMPNCLLGYWKFWPCYWCSPSSSLDAYTLHKASQVSGSGPCFTDTTEGGLWGCADGHSRYFGQGRLWWWLLWASPGEAGMARLWDLWQEYPNGWIQWCNYAVRTSGLASEFPTCQECSYHVLRTMWEIILGASWVPHKPASCKTW